MSKSLLRRLERERILKAYDPSSLQVTYKVVLGIPLDNALGDIPKEAMIDAILRTEYGEDRREAGIDSP